MNFDEMTLLLDLKGAYFSALVLHFMNLDSKKPILQRKLVKLQTIEFLTIYSEKIERKTSQNRRSYGNKMSALDNFDFKNLTELLRVKEKNYSKWLYKYKKKAL